MAGFRALCKCFGGGWQGRLRRTSAGNIRCQFQGREFKEEETSYMDKRHNHRDIGLSTVLA